jgi:hypothetical protein
MAQNAHGQSTPGKGKYDWGPGGKVHSIPLAQHQLDTRSLTAPPNYGQALQEANAAADLQYGPGVASAQRLAGNVAPWFADHLARVAGYAQAAQRMMAPTLAQAQAYQQGAAAQLPPGIDPNSQAGQQAAQAASGRQSIAQLGLDALNTQGQATQDYFGGLQSSASRELPQAQSAADVALAQAQGQRGAAVNSYLTSARQNAQNYAIARGTLNLNTDKAASDATLGAAKLTADTQAKKDKAAADAKARKDAATAKGETVNKYGYTADQWSRFSPGHRQQIMTQLGQGAGTGKDAKNHADAITKASGKIQNQITDITNFRQTDVGQPTDDTSAQNGFNGGKDPKTKQYPSRPVTQADVDREKVAKYGMLARIAIAIRDGRKLDQNAIDYLHNQDPNFRIPRSWLPQPRKGTPGVANVPSASSPSDPYGSGPGHH